jgi:hypothetical protein
MYLSFLLHHKFPSSANINHKNLDGAHCLELFLYCPTPYFHNRFVDQIHLHKCQCIVPPEWLGSHMRLYPKILQRHIVCVHFSLVQPQLVLSHLQGMHYGEDLFLMTWLSPLTTIELHAFICNGHPSCMNAPPIAKSFTPICISKDLSNFT